MTRAAAYVRVSTTRQAEEGLSLAEQSRRAIDYIALQGWELAGVYEDAGISGRREDRPALQRLLGELEGLDKLVILKLDRFGRSARHTFELFERLQVANVDLVSLNDGWDTSTASGRMIPKMLAVMAEYESDMLAERVRGVMRARVEGGEHLGAPNYGTRKGGGTITPVSGELAVVERIYREFVAGASQNAIQRGLNEDGIPGPGGKGWNQGTVSRILRNPIYGGQVRYQGDHFEGSHEPLIPLDLWGEAQQRLAAMVPRGAGRGRPPRGTHLFLHGFLRCDRCGFAMSPRGDYYACRGRLQRGPDFCEQPRIKREQVDSAALAYFETAGLDIDATRDQMAATVEVKLAEIRALRMQAERDERQAAESLARVKRDYTSGKLAIEDWHEFRDDLKAEQAAARAKLERLTVQEQQAQGESLRDAEAETLRFLAEVQAAVKSGRDAGEMAAVRAALLRLFDGFTLRRLSPTALKGVYVTPFYRDVVYEALEQIGPDATYELVPHVREDAIAGYGPSGVTAKPARVPLARAVNNYAEGWLSACLLTPIRCDPGANI